MGVLVDRGEGLEEDVAVGPNPERPRLVVWPEAHLQPRFNNQFNQNEDLIINLKTKQLNWT